MILELVSEKFSTLGNLIIQTDPGVAELRGKKIAGDPYIFLNKKVNKINKNWEWAKY